MQTMRFMQAALRVFPSLSDTVESSDNAYVAAYIRKDAPNSHNPQGAGLKLGK